MSCDFTSLATPGVLSMHPYEPGKPMEELERELGITDIIKLASNENAMGPSPKVIEAIKNPQDLYRYPDGNGFHLKQALSSLHKVNVDQITLGNGSNDILDLIARAFVTDKHQVIYSEHAFVVYMLATKSVGAEGIEVPAKEFANDFKAMEAAITDRTRLIYVANPNNPTGTWAGEKEIDEFMQAVPEHVLVVMDQAYFEYARGADYPDCISWVGRFPNLVVTRTFSKAYGLAGLRMGYSVSHPDVADLMNRIRHPFNVNSLALLAAEVALTDQDHIAKSVKFNKNGMQQLVEGLDDMAIHFIPSRGNFISLDLQQDAMPVFNLLLKEGVIVRPIAGYGMPNYLRVTVGLAEENERFLKALSKVLAH